MRKNRTRNERKLFWLQIIRVVILVVLLSVLLVLFGRAAQAEAPETGREYLTSMGVSPAQQEYIFSAIE